MNDNEPELTRRRVLKVAGATSLIGVGTAGSAVARPPQFDPKDVNGTIVGDAPEPTFRIDNYNGTAAMVMLQTDGGSNGDVYTVGANQASYDPPSGKYVSVECGEVINGLLTKRPQDDEWVDSGFVPTATAPSCD